MQGLGLPVHEPPAEGHRASRSNRLTCLALVVSVAVIASATYASAATTKLPLPVLNFSLGARLSPSTLPEKERAPVGLEMFARIKTSDVTHPSALRKLVLAADRRIAISTRGLPACRYRRVVSPDPRRACRSSIVGTGIATAELAYPEDAPIAVESGLTVFNGGSRGEATMLFVHGSVPALDSEAIVSRVLVKRTKADRPGWQATVHVPQIADGYGSLLSVRVELRRFFVHRGKKRSLLYSSCPAKGQIMFSNPLSVFRNEARIPGVAAQTAIRGAGAIPCRPQG